MRHKKNIAFICLLLVYLSALGCDRPNRLDYLKYKRVMKEERAKKDKAFKFAPNSPIQENKRWQFKKLNYFPVDISYKVDATYRATPQQETVIKTSSGVPRVYVTLGVFAFRLKGKAIELLAYQEKTWLQEGGQHALFVPFTDKTTGKETYGAGRYLDIVKPTDNKAIIDFNRAYNPYCAYNDSFSCPIPPEGNYIPLAIEAGEKK